MADKEFNLLEEKWIRVMDANCQVQEVSLTDALLHAHEYQGLAGELPTQDAALLRLLLAVLHAVFERVDIEGEPSEIDSEDEAIDRWESLWRKGQFPASPIQDYLKTQKENFWLFHPEKPFYQIPEADSGTKYGAEKLNGSISESSNKVRLFSERTGEAKDCLSFAEAARWLLYVNAFDDTSSKPSKEGKMANGGKLPSPGAGWLGKIGYIFIQGNNLFETLMLNLVLWNTEKNESWESCIPHWELENPNKGERTQIPVPNDQAELLTLQSRRLLLHQEDGCVNGYSLLGGDFFEKEYAFTEQMTVWGAIKDKKGMITGYQPRRHNKARQMWRDFGFYASVENAKRKPGIINWNVTLQISEVLPKQVVYHLTIASVQYGDKDFFAADIFSDTLDIHLNLFTQVGKEYCQIIIDEIENCEEIANNIGRLAENLFLASGGDSEKKKEPGSKAKEQFYYEIDVPFRQWLAQLDAEDTDKEEQVKKWRAKAKKIAYRLAEKMVQDAGKPAFVGKLVTEKAKKRYYSSSSAMQWFKMGMSKI